MGVGVGRAYQTINAALFAFRQVLGALPLLKDGLALSFQGSRRMVKNSQLSMICFDLRACLRDHPPFFEIRVVVVANPLHLASWSRVTANTGS